LTNIIKKDLKYHWNEITQKAFEWLKQKFAKKLILTNYDSKRENMLEIDASNREIEAIYSQKNDNERWKSVTFYFRKLSSVEQNYEIHDKKLLIIVKNFKEWRVYLEEIKHKIQMYTDHKNLTYFITTKVLNRRQIWWAKKMTRYNFVITYRKESKNDKTNVLNRRSNNFDKKKNQDEVILKDEDDEIIFNQKYLMTIISINIEMSLLNRIRDVTKKDDTIEKWIQGMPLMTAKRLYRIFLEYSFRTLSENFDVELIY
jgi:hypothetical protein